MQCATCQLPLPPGSPACPLCRDDELTIELTERARLGKAPWTDGEAEADATSGLAPVLARGARRVPLPAEAGLAPLLAPRVVELGPGAAWRQELEALPPGSTVRLRPGLYRFEGELALPPGLTLAGAGKERTLLEGMAAAGRTLLAYQGPGLLTLQGLAVRPHLAFWQRLMGGGERPHLLGVRGGAYLLEGCGFHQADGVRAEAPGTAVGCSFSGEGAIGLASTALLWVDASEFEDVARGVDVRGSRLLVSNSRFSRSDVAVAWDADAIDLPTVLPGCRVARCTFRQNRETVLPKPSWRCRWNDNQYER